MEYLPLSYRELEYLAFGLYQGRNSGVSVKIRLTSYPGPMDFCMRLFRLTDYQESPCCILGERLVLHIIDSILESDIEIWERLAHERNTV